MLWGLSQVCLIFNFFNISGTRIETPASCTYQGTSKYLVCFLTRLVLLQVRRRRFAVFGRVIWLGISKI